MKQLQTKQNKMENTAKRIEELKLALKTTPKPKLGISSVEDVDDAYQDLLEYNWWKRETEDEIKQLELELNSFETN